MSYLHGEEGFSWGFVLDTAAAVLEGEPDRHALPAKSPARIREALRQCSQKDAERGRLSSIAEARKTKTQEPLATTGCSSGFVGDCAWATVVARPASAAGPLRVGSAHEPARSRRLGLAFGGWSNARLCPQPSHLVWRGEIYVVHDGAPRLAAPCPRRPENGPGCFCRTAHASRIPWWMRRLTGILGSFPCAAASHNDGSATLSILSGPDRGTYYSRKSKPTLAWAS